MELSIERRRSNQRSQSPIIVEQLGVIPDASGDYILYDGTAVVIDTSGVNPDNDWTWRSEGLGEKHWPVKIQADLLPDAKWYLHELKEGVEIELDEDGRGRYELTPTRDLVVKLDRPIWKREELGRQIIETYYPQNTE